MSPGIVNPRRKVVALILSGVFLGLDSSTIDSCSKAPCFSPLASCSAGSWSGRSRQIRRRLPMQELRRSSCSLSCWQSGSGHSWTLGARRDGEQARLSASLFRRGAQVGGRSHQVGAGLGLCPSCAQLQRIPDHFSTLERTRPSEASCSTSNSYAHLRRPGNRTENPGVGGSIPSLPTMFFRRDFDELVRS